MELQQARKSAKWNRQKGALTRLENQLASGTKTVRDEHDGFISVELEEKDKVRIGKEIEILKLKLR